MFRLGDLEQGRGRSRQARRASRRSFHSLGPYSIIVRTGLDLEHGCLAEAEKGCQQMEAILEMFECPRPRAVDALDARKARDVARAAGSRHA